MKTIKFSIVLLILILLSACGSNESAVPTATPIDISALQTAAVQTIVANITQTAAAQPTLAPTETLTPVPEATQTETPTPVLTATPALCDNLVYINDASVTDGTQMTAGQSFVKSWKVKNTGVCSWKTTYKIVYGYGNDKMSGLTTALTAEVLPGSEVEISINLKAPDKPGNYSGYWRLANNNGVPFGPFLSVIIVVP